jgi:hypothetical protein
MKRDETQITLITRIQRRAMSFELGRMRAGVEAKMHKEERISNLKCHVSEIKDKRKLVLRTKRKTRAALRHAQGIDARATKRTVR